MRLTPASRAAWIARIDWASSGRLARDIGIAPSPIGNTSVSARRRVFVWVVVMSTASPPPVWHKRARGKLVKVDRLYAYSRPVPGHRGHRRARAAREPGRDRDPLRRGAADGRVVDRRRARAPAGARTQPRPPLVPAVRRVLRAPPAPLRRGPAR